MNKDVHAVDSTVPFTPDERVLGVVVGFDGSENATAALQYAAQAAQLRETALTVVTAYRVPIPVYTTLAAMPEEPEDEVRLREAENVLNKAREVLREYPGEVDYRAEEGDSVGALVALSREAQLIVVGARGRGGFLGRVLGSVSSALPGHAHCPTIVVPGGSRPDGGAPGAPVVAGLDESSLSRAAALQAAHEAYDRGVPLDLVMALPPLDSRLVWYPELSPDAAGITERRRAQLTESLEEDIQWLKGHFPSVEITGEVKKGEPAELLREATRTAQLTVLGSRGRGAVASVLLGSTSRGVLYKANGPVMVVPALEDERLHDQPDPLG